jgi:predicted nuclease with TOPRIM domain
MQEQIQSRIEVLKSEFETGQAKLRELEMQQSRLRETLLRISGAIQVLEEMLQSAKPDETSPP